MDIDDARARLAGCRVVRLAIVGADGRPHLVVVTFAVVGDRIYTAVDHKPKTTRALKRLRNIRDNPQVAVLADHYEEDWGRLWWVRADGRGRVREAADVPAAIALLQRKYAQYGDRPPEGPVIEIGVDRWAGWSAADSGAGVR